LPACEEPRNRLFNPSPCWHDGPVANHSLENGMTVFGPRA
jgi:hypothetical protein